MKYVTEQRKQKMVDPPSGPTALETHYEADLRSVDAPTVWKDNGPLQKRHYILLHLLKRTVEIIAAGEK